jgi:putative membrane protein
LVEKPLHLNPWQVYRWLAPPHVGRTLALLLIPALVYVVADTVLIQFLGLPAWAAGKEAANTLGIVLGVLVVLRTNAANDRWWEARKLWGQLINDSRNLALKARAHAAADPEEYRELAHLLAGFAHALRLHLRGQGGIRSVPGFESAPTDFPHGPGYVAELVHRLLNRWNRQGKLRDTVWMLDVHARALMDICGACERIRNTPLPASYRLLLRSGIGLYILVAPWTVSPELGWWGVALLVLEFGFLLGIELTAEAIEEPFGTEKDDLPLETYCQTVETFVRAMLEAPEPALTEGAARA